VAGGATDARGALGVDRGDAASGGHGAPDSGLRSWQRRALAEMERWGQGPFLLAAAPGAGKTRPALEFARRELARGAIDGVLVVCPTAPLTRQWARAASELGVELAPDASSPRRPRGFHGVAVTYARIAKAPVRWRQATGPRTLVIADEAHHLGEDLAWGETFGRAFGACRRWLLLSGTPFRSDATPIPGVRYDAAGLAEPDVSYGYAEAVLDGICRPVCFVAYDGTLSWRSGDQVIESSFETVLSAREAGRRYRTAISTELPDGLPRILAEADARLRTLRREGHGDAGGLVIAADSSHARRIAALLREATGRAPVVVLHAEPRAAAKLSAFTHSRDPWIVAVNMVSEGVDIPRLRVGVYATAAKTPLVFRQIVGRFVRTIQGRPVEPSWLYIPADTVLRDHAASIEGELRRAARPRDESGDGLEFDRADRAASERSEAPAFVPLSADVAPQLTLFGPAPGGGPPPAAWPTVTTAHDAWPPATAAESSWPPATAAERSWPPAADSDWPPAAAVADNGWPPAEVAAAPTEVAAAPAGVAIAPAFERRESLRRERHRLVSELARRDGMSHREANAWLNRKLGIRSVEQATIQELERSVELLVGKLTRQR
jgi:superfamily II DNA or RNA helicase